MPDIPSEEQPIPKIVLTGGPCAGKTTALSHLFDRLASMGMKPIMVPEAATVVIGAGVTPGSVTTGEFQAGIMRAQLALENIFETYARQMPAGCRPVLICGRFRRDHGMKSFWRECWCPSLRQRFASNARPATRRFVCRRCTRRFPFIALYAIRGSPFTHRPRIFLKQN